MLAYGPSEAPLTSPIQSRERSRSLYHRRRVLHTSSGPPLLSSCGTDRAVRKHRHMVAKRKDTEVVSQCHVGRSAHPVDCHHLARRLDDDQVLELEDMFDQDTCRLSWGARDRRSVHRWEDQASPRRIGAFVYTVGLRATRGARRWETGIISKHTSRETRYASIAVKATNSALAAIRPRMMAQAAGWARFIVQPMPKRLGRNKLASSRLR